MVVAFEIAGAAARPDNLKGKLCSQDTRLLMLASP